MKATDRLRASRLPDGRVAGNSRDELVNGQISQVYCIARRIRRRLPQQVELDDLVSAGVVGLVQAALSFDSGKQVPFSAFAKFRIHGAIMDSLRETDWASRSLRKSGREIDQASGRLQSMLGRQPSETEIARELGISAERFQMIQGQIHSMKVLVQQAAHAHDDSELTDLIESAPNENDPNPLEIYLAGERKALLAEAGCQGRSKRRPLGRRNREPLVSKKLLFRGRRGAGA